MEAFRTLLEGPVHRFADWPTGAVPAVAAGVYTIWDGATFIYVGMSGRKQTAAGLAAQTKRTGLHVRLGMHAAGRRSGDQFCVYIGDRFVLPALTREEIASVAAGATSFDRLIRDYIHSRLTFRWVVTADGPEAYALEALFRRGDSPAGAPFLNPLR